MLTPIRIRPLRLLAVLTFPVWGFLLMLALFVAMMADDVRMLFAEFGRKD